MEFVKKDINGQQYFVHQSMGDNIELLSKKYDIDFAQTDLAQEFITIFLIHYWQGLKSFGSDATIARTNWTINSHLSFFNSCKLLGYKADFEAEGRQDAILYDSLGNVFLCAEWEWNAQDVFGQGKEIDKLYKTLKKRGSTQLQPIAFLLTYIEEDRYTKYIERIYLEWIQLIGKEDYQICVSTVLFKRDEESGQSNMITIRTVLMDKIGMKFRSDF